ncbi:MAG: hypothetical protein VW550_03555 [Thalassospira sp.]
MPTSTDPARESHHDDTRKANPLLFGSLTKPFRFLTRSTNAEIPDNRSHSNQMVLRQPFAHVPVRSQPESP